MRRTVFGLMAMILLALAVPLVSAQSVLDVSVINQQPLPAEPGDLVDVRIQVQNPGTATARDVQIQVIDTEGLTPEGRTSVQVSDLPARETYSTTFRVRVESGAQAGERLLLVETKQSGMDWQRHELPITVGAGNAAVFISGVESVPSSMVPGEDAAVRLTVENAARTLLRDITVQLDLTEAPLVPTAGTARTKIATLSAGDSETAEFRLEAKPGAESDSYRIPVTITFLDELGETQTQEDVIGLRIEAAPELVAYLDGVQRTEEGVEVSVRLVNQGLAGVKFLQFTVQDGEGYSLLPQDRSTYLGNIDSDDWETARFVLTEADDTVTIPVTYTYHDAFNTRHNATSAFTIEIPAPERNVSGFVLTLLLVAATAVGIWLWRRRK